MITIMLAEDHTIVREGLTTLLNTVPDFDVVGDVADGLEAIRMAEQLRPDILVVDLMMPGLSGYEVIRQVSQHVPGTHVVVLSMHTTEAHVLEALRSGALGYVQKGGNSAELISAIRAAAAGKRYLGEPFTERAIESYIQRATTAKFDKYETLTQRERQVLHLSAEGHSKAEIAERLCISARTVETHQNNIKRKLSLKTQAEMFRYAVRRGLIAGEP